MENVLNVGVSFNDERDMDKQKYDELMTLSSLSQSDIKVFCKKMLEVSQDRWDEDYDKLLDYVISSDEWSYSDQLETIENAKHNIEDAQEEIQEATKELEKYKYRIKELSRLRHSIEKHQNPLSSCNKLQ